MITNPLENHWVVNAYKIEKMFLMDDVAMSLTKTLEEFHTCPRRLVQHCLKKMRGQQPKWSPKEGWLPQGWRAAGSHQEGHAGC